MRHHESKSQRRIVGRLEKGDDLAGALVEICRAHNVNAGEIRALGAVSYLEVTEYDTQAGKYRPPLVRQGDAEILMLYGNLSEKDGELFAHLHVTASYFENGRPALIAGHVNKATVFACEYVIDAFDDLELVRAPDTPTGLMLWDEVKKR